MRIQPRPEFPADMPNTIGNFGLMFQHLWTSVFSVCSESVRGNPTMRGKVPSLPTARDATRRQSCARFSTLQNSPDPPSKIALCRERSDTVSRKASGRKLTTTVRTPASACPTAAGYSVQFSNFSPNTRPNSRVLLLTKVSPRQRAWAAIRRSFPPSSVPGTLRSPRISP